MDPWHTYKVLNADRFGSWDRAGPDRRTEQEAVKKKKKHETVEANGHRSDMIDADGDGHAEVEAAHTDPVGPAVSDALYGCMRVCTDSGLHDAGPHTLELTTGVALARVGSQSVSFRR